MGRACAPFIYITYERPSYGDPGYSGNDLICNSPLTFNTIFFDVDGVLIKTVDSFHATDIATAEFVASNIHGLDWGQNEGKTLVTHEDVIAFKQAGGYNNDWDMCYLLATLCTARLREWKGTPLEKRTIE